MMRRTIGSPATGMAGFARTSVSGRSRVPRPAVRTSACRVIFQPPGWSRHTNLERTSLQRRSADSFAENQHLVCRAEAAGHHEGLQVASGRLRIANVWQQAEQKIRLIKEGDHRQAFFFG